MSKQLRITGISVAIFLSLSFICQSRGFTRENTGTPAPKQVGMYLFRCNKVMGCDYFNAQGWLVTKVIVKRDESGNMIERFKYNGSNELLARLVYELDNKGLMHRKTRYGPDGKITWYARYEYNKDGLPVEQKNY